MRTPKASSASSQATGNVAIGSNPERNRTHNRRVVLETVWLHGPIGRTEIARMTHLTAQAVSNIVDELAADGLLIRQGRRKAGRGQPPVQFAVNPDGGATVGVELAADGLVTVLVDLAGQLRAQRRIKLTDTAPDRLVPLVAAEVERIRRTPGGEAAPVLGVGVVMPGPFEIDGLSSVGPTTLPGWSGIDAGAVLSAATGLPVVVENDATAAAVGERLHGAGKSLRDFCLVYFGVGLGLGIVSEGRPFRGAFGNAGEVGHVMVVPDGLPCPCGNRGCLERYASLHALDERLAASGLDAGQRADLDALVRSGHPELTAWTRDAAKKLAPMIAMLENLFDPESIILGGSLPVALLDALIEAMHPLPISVASRRRRSLPRVLAGATGRLTAALGAAALPLLETLAPRLDRARFGETDVPPAIAEKEDSLAD